MISVVNSYVCFSSCDETKAKQGKDPHPSDNTVSGDTKPQKAAGFDRQPAIIFDGALKDMANASNPAGAPTQASRAATLQASVNIIA